uniref:ATP synthase F0 subunit 8 n=1 Tax=Naesiotus nux TaxID=1755238 RepID=A0A0S2IAD8_NAENU|nr:ATP synthase F0 subunit 8 [Naesiotus nux]ALO20563.1 ATP synthase F0 subunit 8 [Naesiotus nux]
MPQLAPHMGLTIFLVMTFLILIYSVLYSKLILPNKKSFSLNKITKKVKIF